jgi:pantetheine-phosphate adenylyltransferase
MKRIAFSGTLDPITNGHMWVIQEARAISEEVVVFISENPFKKPHFSAEKRKLIVEQSVEARGWSNVSVIVVRGDYTARAAKRSGIEYLIRGIRNTTDFDYENLIQQANVDTVHGAKTIFVMPPRDLGSVSSSFIKGLQGPVGWHWAVKRFLPGPAYSAWILDWLRKDWEALWRYGEADAARIANADKWFDHLVGESAYGSPLRPYHNHDHLVHGLSEIAVWAANTKASQRDVETLKKAFWFHDAVYDVPPKQNSNEEESARLWLNSQLDSVDRESPAALIRATDHLQANAIVHPLKDAMLSIDLAILGQPHDVYQDYARSIRLEYRDVEESVYRAKRKQVLGHFREKALSQTLYPNSYFSELYNQQAISNLSQEIAGLENRGD